MFLPEESKGQKICWKEICLEWKMGHHGGKKKQTCKHCGRKGKVKYYYLGLETKVKLSCDSEMCQKMMTHWEEMEHWLEKEHCADSMDNERNFLHK